MTPGGDVRPGRGHGREAGVGSVSASMGVGAFLALLLLTVQLSVNLQATSAATDAAHRAASWLAVQGPAAGQTHVQASAAELARLHLGHARSFSVEVRIEGDDAVVHIRGASPSVLLAAAPDAFPLSEIRATARVRVERFRCATGCGDGT